VAASLSSARQQAHGGARFNERIRTFHYVVSRGGHTLLWWEAV
jgi:hypothetical protein